MALNATAFGPLSAGTQAAYSELGGATTTPRYGLSRLSGLGETTPAQDVASQAQQAGLNVNMAPVPQPMLASADTSAGDITQLPGFQAATSSGGVAALPSTDDSNSTQASDFRAQLQRLAGDQSSTTSTQDAAKALQFTNKALGGANKGQQAAQLSSAAPFGGLSQTGVLNQLSGLQVGQSINPEQLESLGQFSSLPESVGAGGAGAAGAGVGALAALAPLLAQQAGVSDPYALAGLQVGATVGAPAAAGAVGGAAAGTGALAGAGAGLAASAPALIAAAPAAAIMLAQQIGSALDTQSAARDLGIRVKNINSQLPGELGQLQSIPGVASGLSQASTPDETAALLKQLNDISSGFQQGGWEDYLKSGSTRVSGGSSGEDLTAPLPGVQLALSQTTPYLNVMDLSRLRAEDILGRAGYTPDQIAAQTGRYIDPIEMALTLNAQPYEPGSGNFTGAAGPLRQALMKDVPGDWGPYTSNTAPGELTGKGGAAGYQNLNFGFNNIPLLNQLEQIAPGTMEQSLNTFLQGYGGSPVYGGMGLGQGLPATALSAPAVGGTGVPTDATSLAAGLERLVAQQSPQAGTLGANVPSEFSAALSNPQALQSLLSQPGLLARLFAPQGAA